MLKISSLTRLAAVMAVVAINMASSSAAIVKVGPGYYATVQAAINACTPGDQIQICKTDHYEAGFTVPSGKERITISGEGTNIVNFGITSGSIRIDGNSCTLRNINFYQHTSATGIIIKAGIANPIISNCYIVATSNNTNFAIVDNGSGVPSYIGPQIEYCHFYYQTYGVYTYANGLYFNNNYCENTTRNLTWAGVFTIQPGEPEAYTSLSTWENNLLVTGSTGDNIKITATTSPLNKWGTRFLSTNSVYNNWGTSGSNINFNNQYVNLPFVYSGLPGSQPSGFVNNTFSDCPNRAFSNDTKINTDYNRRLTPYGVKNLLQPYNLFSYNCQSF